MAIELVKSVKKIYLMGMVFMLSACVTSRIEQSREAITGIRSDEAIVVMGRVTSHEGITEESFIDCLVNMLSKGPTPVRTVEEDEFRNILYPWFEPATRPTSASDLGDLFRKSGVQDRIEEVNIKYLAWVRGTTETIDQGGSMSCTLTTFGGGCFGMSYWEQDAKYEATIWDLENLTAAGQISAEANGTSYLAGLVVPIPILARPGNAACKGLAAQLRVFVQGEQAQPSSGEVL